LSTHAASTITSGSNRVASQSIAGPTGTTSRSFTYNGRGDVTAETRDGAATSASYDAYGRLATYTRTGTPSFAMLYSGTDERVQVSVDGTPRRLVHDESGRVIGEYGATGTVFAEDIWLIPDTDEGLVLTFTAYIYHRGTGQAFGSPAPNQPPIGARFPSLFHANTRRC
jgi:YD repeat-containing protein